MKKLFLIILLFPLFAFATTYPSEDFEGGADGNKIDATSGGSGWATNWACGASFLFKNTPTLQGSLTSGGAITGGQTCVRTFTAVATDNEAIGYIARTAQTAANQWPEVEIRTGTNPGSLINLYESGQIVTYDNTTITNLQAYSINTNYTFKITVKPSTEEHRINIDGTNYPSATTYYHLYNYTVVNYTGGLDTFFMDAGGNETSYVDDIKDVTPAAGGGAVQINNKYLPSFGG